MKREQINRKRKKAKSNININSIEKQMKKILKIKNNP